MHIALLDPGLSARAGHHFDLDLRLARALATLGHSVSVHGHAQAQADVLDTFSQAGISVGRSFRAPTYAQPRPGVSPVTACQHMLAMTLDDLSRIPSADLWVWPTLAAYQLAAAAQCPSATAQIGVTWWSPRFPLEAGGAEWAQALARIAEQDRPMIVGAYDEGVARHCASFAAGVHIHVPPCPHDGAPVRERSETLRVIGFFGHQRTQRGAELLPLLVTRLLERGYEVVLQDSGGRIRAEQQHPRLHVLPFVEDLPAAMSKCDLVVWPSRWQDYTVQCSGIVSECIASGVPVLLPSGCLPAELALRMGCGALFHEHTGDAILAAVEDAARHHAARVRAARAAADRWNRDHGTMRFARWLVDHGPTPQAR